MEISGFIKMIGQPQQVSSAYRKREIVVTTEEQYPQHILIEFSQDKCDLLNRLQIGQKVKVSINLRGREWTNPQGETRYFNSIQGWRIDGEQPQQQNPTSGYHGHGSAVDDYYNRNTNTQYQQPTFNQNPNNQQTNQAFGNPQGSNQGPNQPQMFNGESDPDDLPF